MGLNYPAITSEILIGSKTTALARTGIILTNAYQAESATVPTKTFETGGYSQCVLDILYTTGGSETSNSIEVKIDSSSDRTNFYQLTNESASGGTSTLTQREFTLVGASAATGYAFSIFLDIAYKYLRVSCKETGVASNYGNVYIEASLSGK
jgi:hypothetical protein